MKGNTVAGRSMPWASPHAATTPRYFVWAITLARVWLPTESIAPAQSSCPIGAPGADRVARSTTSAAPSAVR